MKITAAQRRVLIEMLHGEHINAYGDGKYKTSGGRRLNWATVSRLRHLAYIAEYRPGNYELTPMGKVAAEIEAL